MGECSISEKCKSFAYNHNIFCGTAKISQRIRFCKQNFLVSESTVSLRNAKVWQANKNVKFFILFPSSYLVRVTGSWNIAPDLHMFLHKR